MKTKSYYFISWLLLLVASWSCSVKKYIPEDEFLYKGADLKVETTTDVKDEDEVTEELKNLLKPAPNKKLLGMYVGLYYFYRNQQKTPGFINRFIYKKIGEEPVYFSQVDPVKTEELIINRLENRGFFYSQVTSEVKKKGKFANVNYLARVAEPYLLDTIILESDSLQVEKAISSIMAETKLKEGTRFDLNRLKEERVRIDSTLKTQGYYNFNNDFLIFEADTNRTDTLKKFNLYLRLKNEVPVNGLIPYQLNSINVFPNYSINENGELLDTTELDGKNFIQGEFVFKPRLLNEYILIEKEQLYNPKLSKLTSNRLSSIGNYKFVNLRYEESEKGDSLGYLDANIYLSPMTKRSLRAEALGVSKSNNFAGPALNFTYRNRNLFRGGETLNLSANFGYEFQIASGERAGLESFEVGLRGDLIFPRIIFFVPITEKFSYSVPKTKVSLGTEYLSRGGLYRLNSFYTNFGYFWNANQFVYHELNPISINLVNLSKTSSEFDQILENNPFLAKSFDQNFIAGINYSFYYNKLQNEDKKHGVYTGVNIDLAGNLLNGINSLTNKDQGKFLGLQYAQYAKFDLDLRYYFRPAKGHTIATRVLAGAGFPFGNSVSLPYTKQFFSGGPHSVRSFRIRSIGPGTYKPENFDVNSYFDQSGDIRFEGNIEYRFPIVSILKGALFMDAGNIWLMNENEALPGGKFTKSWAKELAVGTGIGLRIDIQFFVIRFDFATPLRVPYLPEGERWSNSFDIGSKSWRRQNLIFNFAIGYPF
jgi:outer membrane protein assembly factor BamA